MSNSLFIEIIYISWPIVPPYNNEFSHIISKKPFLLKRLKINEREKTTKSDNTEYFLPLKEEQESLDMVVLGESSSKKLFKSKRKKKKKKEWEDSSSYCALCSHFPSVHR